MTDAAELVKLARGLTLNMRGIAKGIDNGMPHFMERAHGVLLQAADIIDALAAQQDGDDETGMAWWNSLTDEGRKKWVQPSGRAVDAWMAFKLAQQDGREFERLIPSRLAEAFGVSWERAQKAQDNLGWLYRRRASLKPNGDVEQ